MSEEEVKRAVEFAVTPVEKVLAAEVARLRARQAQTEKERDNVDADYRRDTEILAARCRTAGARVEELQRERNRAQADLAAARMGQGEAEERVGVLEAALRLARNGLPDAMYPGIPPQFVDGLVHAQIVIADALGDDDPGDVEAARRALDSGEPSNMNAEQAQEFDAYLGRKEESP